jgi:hypothetical protein
MQMLGGKGGGGGGGRGGAPSYDESEYSPPSDEFDAPPVRSSQGARSEDDIPF